MGKRIYLNAFDMNCIGHQSPGLWTHPEDESQRYAEIEYWVELAQLLEKGRFDGLFLADVVGVYDVYEGKPDAAIASAVQVPVNDPLLIISAMSHATKHLGFGVTYALTYEYPYMLAHRLSTLDHITKGRISWNIVTSYLNSAAKSFGLTKQIAHDERYNIAEEFIEVCYKLWEGSWEADAVIKDKTRRIYADPRKVHAINHAGKYFNVQGIHLNEPSPQRTPVLFQAGTSTKGREFAARHAECIFLNGLSPEIVGNNVKRLREEAKVQGRSEDDIKIFTIFTPIVGETEEQAKEKYEELKKYISYEGALALLGGWTGIDFSKYDPDQELEYIETDAIQSVLEGYTKANPNKKWTVREIALETGVGGFGPVAVGTPEQIADEMEHWIRTTGIDGFNIAYALAPGTIKDFITYVIPILQERGLVQTDYEEGTYREKLFGQGNGSLPENHPGSKFQITKSIV
ncbi:LLM class flavin-dependent oxidoreductase [Schinkia sp. CFF1]